MSSNTRTAGKIAVSLVLGALAAGATVTAVSAAGPIPQDKTTGSLTVHKQEQPDAKGQRATGLENTAANANKPIKDIKFKVRKVNEIDLRTNEGWANAAKVSTAINNAASKNVTISEADGFNFTLGQEVEMTTGENGLATFSDLPLGQYIVTEELTEEQSRTIRGGNAFAVTIPMTHPDNLNEWVYDVHVYPKNTILDNKKSVVDQDFFTPNIADETAQNADLKFPLEVKVPGSDSFETLAIRDPYVGVKENDSALWISRGFSDVKIKGATTDIALAENVDYTVTNNPGEGAIIALNETGVQKVKEARDKEPVKLMASILADYKGTENPGEFQNLALVYFTNADLDTGKRVPPTPPTPDNPPTPPTGDPGTPTSTPTTKLGGIKVKKVGSDAPAKGLQGAEFQVYGSHTNNFNGATKLTVGDSDTFRTEADGTVTIKGLRYSGFANGAEVQPGAAEYNYYWLVETKAPTGYELLAEPVPFTVDGQTHVVEKEVVNISRPNGSLPLTGSSAQALVAFASVAAAGGAAFLAIRRKNKN